MVREINVSCICQASAADFWSLRNDRGYDEWFAELDGQRSILIKNEQTPQEDGLVYGQRTVRLEFKENPVPQYLRKKFKLDNFAFLVTSSYYKNAFDEEHPYTYSTEFPVLTDRITVEGVQWAEEISEERCRLHARVRIAVQLNVLGPQIERQIEKGIRAAYAELPERACDFLVHRGSSPRMGGARRGRTYSSCSSPGGTGSAGSPSSPLQAAAAGSVVMLGGVGDGEGSEGSEGAGGAGAQPGGAPPGRPPPLITDPGAALGDEAASLLTSSKAGGGGGGGGVGVGGVGRCASAVSSLLTPPQVGAREILASSFPAAAAAADSAAGGVVGAEPSDAAAAAAAAAASGADEGTMMGTVAVGGVGGGGGGGGAPRVSRQSSRRLSLGAEIEMGFSQAAPRSSLEALAVCLAPEMHTRLTAAQRSAATTARALESRHREELAGLAVLLARAEGDKQRAVADAKAEVKQLTFELQVLHPLHIPSGASAPPVRCLCPSPRSCRRRSSS